MVTYGDTGMPPWGVKWFKAGVIYIKRWSGLSEGDNRAVFSFNEVS